ncbi:MAG: Acetyltransferase, GNAT family, partial [candidate division CPR2 bacterium GW2011_GWC1_39_9]
INLGVIENNIFAIKLYKSVGFEVEGKMKDEVWHDGIYYNFLSMALFNNE